ncbi:MAG: metalloregulator ArsR/SmtB family transcription factor [Xanthomonadaceae bacterium]|nr:metalloregulator ArsR/SmtB family transcription factor [Xanthomonadaceae bacterium]
MSLPFLSAVSALRAAGEPSRLRLLALLARAELTVGELCEIVGQSQPRVSRHLKVLSSAGLLNRFREEHWVYYRVPTTGESSEVARQLLSLMAEDDPVLQRDRVRMDAVIAERARRASNQLRPDVDLPNRIAIETLVVREFVDKPVGVLLDIGTGSGYLLELLAPRATRAIGIDISTDALRLARTNVHGAGLSHCELQQGNMYDLPFAEATFDTVTLDRLLAAADRPLVALAEIARTLKAEGRLILIEDFDALHEAVHANPINVLREWLVRSGFACTRIHPIDTETAHLIVAVGERVASAVAAA